MADVNKAQLLERESRWLRPVLIATIAAILLYLVSYLIVSVGGLIDNKNDATQLVSFHDHAAGLLLVSLMQGIALALFSALLFYLFKAAQARNDRVHSVYVAFCFIGPAFLLAATVVSWIGLNQIANQFADQSHGVLNGALAKNLLEDSNTRGVAAGLGLVGTLGLAIGVVYIALSAMRVGLLTRMIGRVGVGLGVLSPLMGPVPLLVWGVFAALMASGWRQAARPPAWETGEAVPWPTPDKGPGLLGGGTQVADGEVVEGRGVIQGTEPEVTPDDRWGGDFSEDEAPTEPVPGALEGSQGERRKKRKRRG